FFFAVWQLHGSGTVLCDSQHISHRWPPVPSDGRGCRLCPRDWLQHGNWCYWVSHESRDWQRSRDDCAQKGSALFIIRNREQMVNQGPVLGWGQLETPRAKGTWTWLDGSVLDTKTWSEPSPGGKGEAGGFLSPPAPGQGPSPSSCRFRILGSATSGSCALIKDSQIRSEGCNAESRWVCEKDAVTL
uniref:C-type lectin domain-containing protein n=1 Tax=Anas platyrhynchos TaxID=8839 RepID=A0A8B9SX19_ANAPL